jgi:hypothetical protein
VSQFEKFRSRNPQMRMSAYSPGRKPGGPGDQNRLARFNGRQIFHPLKRADLLFVISTTGCASLTRGYMLTVSYAD